MQTRRLGRTEHNSSIAILGGAAFGISDPDTTERAFHQALERGVNHLDIAPQYGAAESLVGPFVPAVRDRLFVACKTLRKHPDGVRAQLDESLTKLGCDHFDLYQLHAVTTIDELDARAEAAEVIFAARDEGLVRHVGITGHDITVPATFIEALERYDFDTVMFPVYPGVWADPIYRADAERLLAICQERDLGVMAIKAAARKPWPSGDRFATTWYEPYADAEQVARGVTFALSTPGVTAFCTPGDLDVLDLALAAAEAFTPVDADGREAAIHAMADEHVIFPIPH
jgi:aryl-alcohol dehydrogenase-like predicted oxidoreductase